MNRKFVSTLCCVALAVALLFALAASAGAVRPATPKSTVSLANVAQVAVTPVSTTPAFLPLSKTTYVYITKTGKKYHKSGCKYLKKSKIKKTLKWAKANGYKPCSVCKPPK